VKLVEALSRKGSSEDGALLRVVNVKLMKFLLTQFFHLPVTSSLLASNVLSDTFLVQY
jgi:hypothetical protein